MPVLYIQLRKNRIAVRDIDRKKDVSAQATFSNQRLLIADFLQAEKALSGLIQQLYPATLISSLLRSRRFDIVISALEMNEGGLSPVEERILQEVIAGATRMKYRQIKIHAQTAPLTDSAVLTMLEKE